MCKKFTYVHTHKQIHTNIKQKTQTGMNKHKHKTKTQKLQHATSRENKSKPPSEKRGEKGMSDGQRGGSKKKTDMGRPCRREVEWATGMLIINWFTLHQNFNRLILSVKISYQFKK